MGGRKFRLHRRKRYSRPPKLSLMLSIPRVHLDWKKLCEDVKKLHFESWSSVITGDISAIKLCKFTPSTPPAALMTLTILSSYEWRLHVGNKLVSGLELPASINSISELLSLLNHINKLQVCQGINEQKFDLLIHSHEGLFANQQGEFMRWEETNST